MNAWWTRYLPDIIREWLDGRQQLQKVIGNTGWLLSDRILRMSVGLFVNVWVARYLGPAQFGLLNYVIAFAALFSSLASLGLDGIVVREIVREPDRREEILGSAIIMKMAGGIASLLVTITAITLLRQGDPQVRLLVGIVAAGAIFQSFDAIDFWFQSQLQSRYTVYAKNAAFLIIAAGKVALIITGAPLMAFALATLAETALGAFGLVTMYQQSGFRLTLRHGSFARCRKLLHDSYPLMISGISIMVYMKIDQVMLGHMAGNEAVGIYSAATSISEVWYFLPLAIVSSVFPSIVQAKSVSEESYYRRLSALFSLMSGLALVIAIPVTFLSTSAVRLLYGSSYLEAGTVLSVHIWASLFVFLGVAQTPWDITENLTRLAMFRTICGAIINIVLNVILIPRYSALGAAIATLISYAFSSVFLNLLHSKSRAIFFYQLKSLFFIRNLRGQG